MRWIAIPIVCVTLAMSWAAEPGKPLYQMNFEKATVGGVPEEFLVLEGAFAVKEEGGNKFLELPGAPLDTFGVLFGPTEKDGVAVTARIFGTGKGRTFPSFAVGSNGAAGYRLVVSPAKHLIELYRGDSAKASAPFTWTSGKWTQLRLEVRKTEAGSRRIEGKAWTEGAPEPAAAMIGFEDHEEPPPGRASIWGSPYSGTPIRYDDLTVLSAK